MTGRTVIPCACAGALVGSADVLDTFLTGWVSRLTPSELSAFFAAGPLVGAGAGVLVGLATGAAVAASGALGLAWSRGDGLRFRSRRLLSAARLQGALVALVALWAAGGFYLFSSIVTAPLWHVIAAVALGGATLVAASRFVRAPFAAPAIWAVTLAAAYLMETRILYAFSRYGLASGVHAASACLLILLVVAAAPPRLGALLSRIASTRNQVIAAALGLAVFFGARLPLDAASNDLKLALYERTTILYRAFHLMPHREMGAAALAAAGRCSTAAADRGGIGSHGGSPPLRGAVVVMIDALRGDHAPKAHRPGLTPALARFAEESVRFGRAYTTLAATRYAVRSMMTGSPSLPKDFVPPDMAFLGTQLGKAGIRTIAVADHSNLEESMIGFDEFIPASAEIDDSERRTNGSRQSYEKARDALAQLAPTQRFFLFAHFYDPHNDYVPNDMFDFGDSLHERYDAEIAYADHWVGRLLEEIEARGLADDTAVIILGDHGDEFWDHRYRWHRVRVYDETTRVPVFLKVPGGARGVEVESAVSIADMAPTVLDLFGLDAAASLGGESLVPFARGERRGRDRIVFTTSPSPQHRTTAAISGARKLIVNQNESLIEYYDLAQDPGEARNLSDDMDILGSDLYCPLVRWIAAQE